MCKNVNIKMGIRKILNGQNIIFFQNKIKKKRDEINIYSI